MAEPIKKAVLQLGFPVCEYAPIGEMLPGMAYLVRRLLENTSNESFLRQSFTEHISVEALLAKPVAPAQPAYEVTDLSGYRAAVLASPVYYGHLLGELNGFLRRNEAALMRMPRALFVVSLTMARPSRSVVAKLVKQTRPFVEKLRPTDVGLFAGVLDTAKLGFFTRLLVKLMKIPAGDFRKSDVVRKWATDVLPRLTAPSPS